jgi:hypothetical protein
MTGRIKKAGVSILIFVLILFAVVACYHKLLIRGPEGEFEYNAIHWGMKEFMYPRLIFNSDSIRSGTWPIWNPYPFGGYPWAANFQSGLFHPLNNLIILTVGYSAEVLQLQLILILFIAGIAMYFCGREFSLGHPAAVLAAASFVGCGFFVGQASYFPQINTLAVFPFCFLFTNRVVRKPGITALSLGSASIAVMIFSGFPTMVFFMGGFSFLFGLLKIFFIDETSAADSRRKLIYLIGLFAVALLLSAVVLIPAVESFGFLTRTSEVGRADWAEVVLGKSFSAHNLLSLPFPFLGLYSLSGHGLWIEFRNCGIGLVGFFLALYFLVFTAGRLKWSLLFLSVAALILSLGFTTPIYAIFYRYLLPVRLVSHPAMDFRAIFLFFLCLSSGLGLEGFLKRRRRMDMRFNLLLLATIIIGGIMMAFSFRGMEYSFGKAFSDNYPWFITIAILIGLTAIKKQYSILLAWSLVALALVDTAWWVNVNFSTVAKPVSPSHWVKRKGKESARTRDVRAANDFGRKREYPSQKGVKSMFWKTFSDSGHDGTRLRYFQDIISSPSGAILSEDFRIQPIYSVKIFDNRDEILDEIYLGTDLHQTGLICREDIHSPGLENKLEALHPPQKSGESFQGDITSFFPNEIHYRLSLPIPALIFFNEIYYPGWRLREGADELPLFKLNHAFRGSYLEGGEHNLVMYFSPTSYRLGLLISGATVLFMIGAVILEKRRK